MSLASVKLASPAVAGGVALDWLAFSIAGAQTGFGPFIAVYLTGMAWTQAEIGTVLSIGTVVGLAGQVPAGALVDAARDKRGAGVIALLAIGFSATLLAALPTPPVVAVAELLHGVASCVLVPALTALSLALAGRARLGERLGRNARYASLGNAIAAATLGVVGTYLSERAVFGLTALLVMPALAVLWFIPAGVPGTEAPAREAAGGRALTEVGRLLLDRRMLALAAAAGLFQLANAAMLPLAAGELTKRVGSAASLVIAACILVPQLVVAVIAPRVGRLAAQRSCRLVLLAGLAAVPVRALLLSVVGSAPAVVAVQVLDGLTGAVIGIAVPVLAAEITRGTNRFNLCLGVVGLAMGLGATLSTLAAGVVADRFGIADALRGLAVPGFAAACVVWLGLPGGHDVPADRRDEPAT